MGEPETYPRPRIKSSEWVAQSVANPQMLGLPHAIPASHCALPDSWWLTASWFWFIHAPARAGTAYSSQHTHLPLAACWLHPYAAWDMCQGMRITHLTFPRVHFSERNRIAELNRTILSYQPFTLQTQIWWNEGKHCESFAATELCQSSLCLPASHHAESRASGSVPTHRVRSKGMYCTLLWRCLNGLGTR